jgi:hypothetical protein
MQMLNALGFVWEAQRGGSCKRNNMEGSSDDGEASSDEVKIIAATPAASKKTKYKPQRNFEDHVDNLGGLACGVSAISTSNSGAGSNGTQQHHPLLSHRYQPRFGHYPFATFLLQHLPVIQHAQEMAQTAAATSSVKPVSLAQFLPLPTVNIPHETVNPVMVYCNNAGLTDPDVDEEFVQKANAFQDKQEVYRKAVRDAVALHQARQEQAQECSAQTTGTRADTQASAVVVAQDYAVRTAADEAAAARWEKGDHHARTSTAFRQVGATVHEDMSCRQPCDLVASSSANDLLQQQQWNLSQQKQDSHVQPEFVFTVPSKTGKFEGLKKVAFPLQTLGSRKFTAPQNYARTTVATNLASHGKSNADGDIFDDADDDDDVPLGYR